MRHAKALLARPQAVVVAGVAMIVGQLGFRAWVLHDGYWLIDDYGFLAHAVDSDLSLSYLFEPYNDHLQVVGNLIVWIVAQSTPYNWSLAAGITLAMQALASVAALVFLVRLAGLRWAILIPLGLYLFSAMTIPGFIWWAAAIVQVPQQLAAFLAMTAHLEYIRSGRRRWIAATAAALGFGMLCDVKVLFTGAALMFLSLYFAEGTTVRERIRSGMWRARAAWFTHGTLFAVYLGLYLFLVSDGGRAGSWRTTVDIFEVMFRYTLGPVLGGGPWRWGAMTDSPLVPAATPEWAVTLLWVGVTIALVWLSRRRRVLLWAVVPWLVCVVVNAQMVSMARGAVFGRMLGAEVRYLGDLAPVTTLMVSVMALMLVPARHQPDVTSWVGQLSRRGRAAAALVVVGVLAGSAMSSVRYATNWHSDFASRTFVSNVITRASLGPVELLDAPVPEFVVPRDSAAKPFARPSEFFAPLGGRVQTVEGGNDVQMLNDTGHVVPASVSGSAAIAHGELRGCGTKVTMDGVMADLVPIPGTPPVPDTWYVEISYLGGGRGKLLVTVGDREERIDIQPGLHNYVLPGHGNPTRLGLQSITPGLVVCVDHAEIGGMALGGPL